MARQLVVAGVLALAVLGRTAILADAAAKNGAYSAVLSICMHYPVTGGAAICGGFEDGAQVFFTMDFNYSAPNYGVAWTENSWSTDNTTYVVIKVTGEDCSPPSPFDFDFIAARCTFNFHWNDYLNEVSGNARADVFFSYGSNNPRQVTSLHNCGDLGFLDGVQPCVNSFTWSYLGLEPI